MASDTQTASVRATGIAALLLFLGLAVYLRPLQPNITALQFAFNADTFLKLLVPFATAYSTLKFAGIAIFGLAVLHIQILKRR